MGEPPGRTLPDPGRRELPALQPGLLRQSVHLQHGGRPLVLGRGAPQLRPRGHRSAGSPRSATARPPSTSTRTGASSSRSSSSPIRRRGSTCRRAVCAPGRWDPRTTVRAALSGSARPGRGPSAPAPTVPNYVDGVAVRDGPNSCKNSWLGGGDVILHFEDIARIWLGGGWYGIDSTGAQPLRPRASTTGSPRSLLEGAAAAPVPEPFYLGLRADGLGTYDSNRGLSARFPTERHPRLERQFARGLLDRARLADGRRRHAARRVQHSRHRAGARSRRRRSATPRTTRTSTASSSEWTSDAHASLSSRSRRTLGLLARPAVACPAAGRGAGSRPGRRARASVRLEVEGIAIADAGPMVAYLEPLGGTPRLRGLRATRSQGQPEGRAFLAAVPGDRRRTERRDAQRRRDLPQRLLVLDARTTSTSGCIRPASRARSPSGTRAWCAPTARSTNR